MADDDVNILELMHMILELQGYDVTTSSDGLSLQALGETPDMVFLDIGMSGSDGSEICHNYKTNPNTSGVPVVLVSANTNLQEIAGRCGANDVLPNRSTSGPWWNLPVNIRWRGKNDPRIQMIIN